MSRDRRLPDDASGQLPDGACAVLRRGQSCPEAAETRSLMCPGRGESRAGRDDFARHMTEEVYWHRSRGVSSVSDGS